MDSLSESWVIFIKIFLSLVVGGVIGAEREYHDKTAGLRTMIFICMGACIFTMLSIQIGGLDDPARVAAMVTSGVGFLGAGVILREGQRLVGINTAATIWLTAALGMGIGWGSPMIVISALVMMVLWFFGPIERWLDRMVEERIYTISTELKPEKFLAIEALIKTSGLKINNRRQVKTGNDMVCTWQASGSFQAHEAFIQALFADPEVKEFRF
jgi:putative Mg2+ transporter-C (MgtC) family protein